MWLVMRGGGVVAELFVLASPELKPDDPFRLHPGLTIRSESSVWCLTASTFQLPGLLREMYITDERHQLAKKSHFTLRSRET